MADASSRKGAEKKITGPLPQRVQLVLSNLVYVEKKELPEPLLDRIIRLAAIHNPEFYKAQAMRLPTYGKPRIISCAENFPEHIGLQRGSLPEVAELFRSHGIALNLRDERVAGRPLNCELFGTLRAEQEEAVSKAAEHDTGVICAPTAFGKTAVAACSSHSGR